MGIKKAESHNMESSLHGFAQQVPRGNNSLFCLFNGFAAPPRNVQHHRDTRNLFEQVIFLAGSDKSPFKTFQGPMSDHHRLPFLQFSFFCGDNFPAYEFRIAHHLKIIHLTCWDLGQLITVF